MSLRVVLLGIISTCQIVIIKTRSESLDCFLPSPDIQYDLYGCSIVLDWDQYITRDCQSEITRAIDYEVQYIDECAGRGDVINETNRLNEPFVLPEKIPGNCSMSTTCFVRMRIRFMNNTWSFFSAWTTLSSNYHSFQS